MTFTELGARFLLLSIDWYYDYLLSNKARRKLSDHWGFNVQLVLLSLSTGSFSSGNVSALTSLAVKRAKLRATILLPLETRKVACGNTVISSPNLVRALLNWYTMMIVSLSGFPSKSLYRPSFSLLLLLPNQFRKFSCQISLNSSKCIFCLAGILT